MYITLFMNQLECEAAVKKSLTATSANNLTVVNDLNKNISSIEQPLSGTLYVRTYMCTLHTYCTYIHICMYVHSYIVEHTRNVNLM